MPQYSLNFVSPGGAAPIPDVLMSKVLNDILAAWAEQAATRKGVLTYQVSLYTPNVLVKEFLEADDYIVLVDILRGKVNRIITNLDDLESLPGASVVRVTKNRISLPEIRANLEDLVRYRLEPLAGYIWTNSLSRDPELLGPYLENRRFQITLDRQEAEGRGKVIEDSLRAYLAESGTPAPWAGVEGGGGSATGAPLAGT